MEHRPRRLAQGRAGLSVRAYYNEFDAVAAAVLRHCAAGGIISSGHVDARSIKDVRPADLDGFTQCHFFAGAGLWSVAARLAGWPDDRPLWSGSCPCQPFSQAGKRAGVADARHLWPDFHRLIGACRPPVVVGEQVSGAAGYAWLDGVAADLEREGYTCEAFDIPAASVDAPHIRQRLYWVAVRNGLADADRGGRAGRQETSERQEGERASAERDHAPIGMAHTRLVGDAIEPGLEGHARHGDGAPGWPVAAGSVAAADGSFWSGAEWLQCHDGKARRTKPGVCMLAHGLAGRIDLWRLAGNSIVPQAAAEFLKAVMEWLDEKELAA